MDSPLLARHHNGDEIGPLFDLVAVGAWLASDLSTFDV